MNLSVVIPAYNEALRLPQSIDTTIAYLKERGYRYEILVVDDGSQDNTADLVAGYQGVRVLYNRKNRGKGYSVRKGLLAARYAHVLFMDSDLATPIQELDKLLGVNTDIAIASRNLEGSEIRTKQSFYRQILGKAFPMLVNMLLIPGIRDSQCGFKLYKRKAARTIAKHQVIDGFAFDVEQLYIARVMGLSITEVPVTWIDKPGSKVDALRDTFSMLKDVLYVRLQAMRGAYTSRR